MLSVDASADGGEVRRSNPGSPTRIKVTPAWGSRRNAGRDDAAVDMPVGSEAAPSNLVLASNISSNRMLQSVVVTTLCMFVMPIGVAALWVLASSSIQALRTMWYLVLPLLVGGTFLFYAPQDRVSELLVTAAVVLLTAITLPTCSLLTDWGWAFVHAVAMALSIGWVITVAVMVVVQIILRRRDQRSHAHPWPMVRMLLARAVVLGQLAFSMTFGGWFGSDTSTAFRVMLCALYPFAILVFKQTSFFITSADKGDHAGEMSMLNFNSQFFAAFPYRAIFLGFSSFWQLLAILAVEIVFKVVRYVLIPLPCSSRAASRLHACLMCSHKKAVHAKRRVSTTVASAVGRPLSKLPASMASLRSLIDESELANFFNEASQRQRLTVKLYVHQAVDTIGLVAAAVLFTLLRTVAKTSFDVPAITSLSQEEWGALLLFYLGAMVVELLLPAFLLTLRWRIFDSKSDAQPLLVQGFYWMNFHQVRIGLAVCSTFFGLLVGMIVASS